MEDAPVHDYPANGHCPFVWCEALSGLDGLPSCHRLPNSTEVRPWENNLHQERDGGCKSTAVKRT